MLFSAEPFRWSQMLGKVVFGRERKKGGHFAAHRVSDVLAGDWS